MKFCVSSKTLFIASVIFLLTDVTTSIEPQPIDKKAKSELSKPQLPPKIFPNENASDSIPHHLQGEIPPLHFPYETTLSNSHADLTTIGSSKSELNKKDANKDTEKDDKGTIGSNKAMIKNKLTKLTKVASEVPDLLKPNMNITVYEDGTENPLNNETDTVLGPNVVNVNKTHEEDNKNSTVDTKSKIAVNETIKENQTSEKNVSMTDIPPSTPSDEHKDENNGTSTSSSAIMTTTNETDTDEKQNVTSTTTEQETANVTTEVSTPSENETLETKNSDNETSHFEYNTTVPITDKTTATPTSKNASTVETETADEKNITTNNYTDSNDTAIEVSSTTVLPSLKVESTTSANVSENLGDQTSAALQHGEHSHATSGKSSAFLQPTESAAILAGVFVGIALLGYVGLLIWRRILEKRYGNREMLVNEDDFYDTNDLRNFEL